VIALYDFIACSVDNDDVCALVSAEFDPVNHDVLLAVLADRLGFDDKTTVPAVITHCVTRGQLWDHLGMSSACVVSNLDLIRHMYLQTKSI
jgi:hypothetical protein